MRIVKKNDKNYVVLYISKNLGGKINIGRLLDRSEKYLFVREFLNACEIKPFENEFQHYFEIKSNGIYSVTEQYTKDTVEYKKYLKASNGEITEISEEQAMAAFDITDEFRDEVRERYTGKKIRLLPGEQIEVFGDNMKLIVTKTENSFCTEIIPLQTYNLPPEEKEPVQSNVHSSEPLQANVLVCPKCGNVLVRKEGPYGPYFACSTYPICRYTIKESNISELQEHKPEKVCKTCGKPMTQRNGKSKFWGCTGYPHCKTTEPFEEPAVENIISAPNAPTTAKPADEFDEAIFAEGFNNYGFLTSFPAVYAEDELPF